MIIVTTNDIPGYRVTNVLGEVMGLTVRALNFGAGITALYAGSHTASFEALKNHKVLAGEVNSDRIASATRSGDWKDGLFVKLWVSNPIPNDPIAVRGDLPAAFKARLAKVVTSLDLSQLPKASQDFLKDEQADGSGFAPQKDGSFDPIRDMVSVLKINLKDLVK